MLEEGPLKFGYTTGNALSTLLRYEMALANASYRTLQQLLFLQGWRREKKGDIIEEEGAAEVPARLVTQVAAAE